MGILRWETKGREGKCLGELFTMRNKEKMSRSLLIRFASRSDMLKAIKEGKGRKMDGFYILVNEARYKKQATLEGRIINKADHSQKKVGLFATSKTNGRSYKEVVQEYQEEISKIIKNFSKHAGRGKTLKGKNQKKTLLLRRCGKIKAMYNPELAQQSIVADGFQCKVSQWHGSLVTVQFDLDEEINEDETVRKERLDRAKVLAFIRKKSDIPLETTVGVEGRQYKIRIKIEEFEEEAVWIDGSMGNCQNRGCLDGEGSHSHWDTSSNWGDKWNSDEIPDVEEVNDSEKAGDEGTTKEVHGLSDIARMYNSRDNLVATCEAGQNSPMNCVACHNLQEDDLLDVPIGNATTTESEESSFCIMNYNGLVISGKGIRNGSGSVISGGRNYEKNGRDDGAKSERVQEAATTLEVGEEVGFRFKENREQAIAKLASLDEGSE
ncbi:hypothetical protein V6N13_133797 [Hibiscus sabdariffa]